MTITVTRWPSKVVHAGIVRGDRVVPACRPETKATYKRLPGHMTVRCRLCLLKERQKSRVLGLQLLTPNH